MKYVQKGAASVYKDSSAVGNVHDAITEALEKTGKGKQHVGGIAAGVAGYDSAADLPWVESLTDITGITCPRWHVNDAIVAHYGALMARPGIVVISGTGSNFAPAITQAADQGSSVAVTVCDRAIRQIKVGIELLSRSFTGDTVDVAFIGGVINSPYFFNRLSEQLISGNHKRFTVAKPILPPVAGAVLFAMSRLGLPAGEETIRHLREFA